MTTAEQAEALLAEVLDAYANRDITNQLPLSEMLDQALTFYNDDVAMSVESIIGDTLAGQFTKSIPTAVVNPVKLSDLLYSNSDQVARETMVILDQANKTASTAGSVAKELYSGYNTGNDVLDVIEDMPKYLQDFLDDPANYEKFMDQVSNLATKPLSVANKELAYAVEAMNAEAMDKALANVLEEKARYYADRIAKTEIQRAKELANAQSMMLDPNIQYVKWQLSSRHRIFDICDYYHRLDLGYGAGVYPVGQSPMIPLHPFCMCKVVPHYKKIRKKKIKDPTKDLFAGLTLAQQKAIVGSWDKLDQYMTGTPLLAILNASRPKYPLINVGDVLNKVVIPPKVIPPLADLKIDPIQDTKAIPPDQLLFKDTVQNQYPNSYTQGIIPDSRLIIANYDPPNMVVKKGADGYYQRAGTVLSSDLDDHTFLHEYGHHIDQMMGREITGDTLFGDSLSQITAIKKEMYDAMMDDMRNSLGLTASNLHEKLDPLLELWFDKKKVYYVRGRNKGKYKGTRKIPRASAYRAFSDIIDSMLSGRFQRDFYTFGHGTRYYKKMDNRLAENFANLFAVWARGTEWQEAKKLFPAMTKQFENMMKGK